MPRSFPHEWPRRALAVALALGLIAEPGRAACAFAQAASPFPEVPLATMPPPSHAWAHVALGTGVALVGASFAFAVRADDAYDAYRVETDPPRIERLYDRAVLYDRLSSGALLTGEGLFATGIYLRFIRRPPPAHLTFALRPGRCALAYRF